jgi:hypothetical protein
LALNYSKGSITGGTTAVSAINGSQIEITGGELIRLTVFTSSVADVYGGTVSNGVGVKLGTINNHGGDLGDDVSIRYSGTANFYGGVVGDRLKVWEGAVVNVFGGEVGDSMLVEGQYNPKFSTANIYGGDIGPGLTIKEAVLNIYDGTVDSAITISGQSQVTIYGTDFALDVAPGEPGSNLMDLLTPNAPYLLDIRQATLTATLADGSPFELGLFTSSPGQNMSPYAKIYLVLVQVPETTTASLASLVLVGLTSAWRRRSFGKLLRLFGHRIC